MLNKKEDFKDLELDTYRTIFEGYFLFHAFQVPLEYTDYIDWLKFLGFKSSIL